MNAPLLTVSDIAVRFPAPQTKRWPWSRPKQVCAVNGVSFDLESGQTLGIVGESGCGKSSLIRAIAGLTPIASGSVALDGERIVYETRAGRDRARRAMQMIFQDPIAALNPRMTVREIVTEPLLYFAQDLSAAERVRQADEMLERVSIPPATSNRFPHEFSGGQCQRIGIARALVARPRILLCDEPVSALDVSIQAQVVNLLQDLQNDMDLALIFVAHDLGIVRHVSDEVLVMYLGATMERTTAARLTQDRGHPYTRALLSAVPVPDPRAVVAPAPLSGELPSPLDLPPGCFFAPRCPISVPNCRAQRPELTRTGHGAVACIKVAAGD